MNAPRRGDYITFSGMPSAFVTTSGLVRGMTEQGTRRVIGCDATTLTVRDVHSNHVREWLAARTEDWVVWPLADMRRAIRRGVAAAMDWLSGRIDA